MVAGDETSGGNASTAGNCYSKCPRQRSVDQDCSKDQQREPYDEGQQNNRTGGGPPRAGGGLNERKELGKGVIHGGVSRAVGGPSSTYAAPFPRGSRDSWYLGEGH